MIIVVCSPNANLLNIFKEKRSFSLTIDLKCENFVAILFYLKKKGQGVKKWKTVLICNYGILLFLYGNKCIREN